MNVKQQLIADMKEAMRGREKFRLETIRYALAQIKNAEIDRGELDDQALIAILKKVTKQIKESISEFSRAQRTDLVTQEKAKLRIMEAYQPPDMDEAELVAIVTKAVAQFKPNMGAIMGQVMSQVKGRADGNRVRQLVQAQLQLVKQQA